VTDLLSRREAARIALARSVPRGSDGLDVAFSNALRLVAAALRVRRVGIWVGNDDWSCIESRLVFDAETQAFSSGHVIDLSAAPAYSAALRSRRTVVASDARSDPNTRELADYLQANDIHAMLDSPIFQDGKFYGVVCHEHVAQPRVWSKADADFAGSVADMIGLYLAQHAAHVITAELLEARAALEQTRVMESLGRMAAGVAHDFNNVLAAIGLKNELLARRSEPGSFAATTAAEVVPLVDQGARIVKQLLTFAREGPPSKEVVDLGSIVRGMQPVLAAMARDEITIAYEVSPSPVNVRIDRSRAEQVLMNLAVNARDAMLGGGTLTVSVSDDPGAHRAILRVTDTGVGMDDATRSRIFEPFFTTKTSGNGVGLGLATVYGIVTESGGRIDVASALSEGTTFTIRLPLA